MFREPSEVGVEDAAVTSVYISTWDIFVIFFSTKLKSLQNTKHFPYLSPCFDMI